MISIFFANIVSAVGLFYFVLSMIAFNFLFAPVDFTKMMASQLLPSKIVSKFPGCDPNYDRNPNFPRADVIVLDKRMDDPKNYTFKLRITNVSNENISLYPYPNLDVWQGCYWFTYDGYGSSSGDREVNLLPGGSTEQLIKITLHDPEVIKICEPHEWVRVRLSYKPRLISEPFKFCIDEQI